MNNIHLNKVIPNVFLHQENLQSDIWNKDILFEKGKSYLVQADSGTGKSTLCSYLYGYREDYTGTILFDDVSIKKNKASVWDTIRTKHISLLFQELYLFPELTAIENVLLKNNLTKYKTEDDIDILFDKLGITAQKKSLVGKMSWGQRQRVALIRCLCQNFDFLMLDEPISHLDDNNAAILSEIITEEISKQGAGLIVTSVGKHLPYDYSLKTML